MLVKGEKYLTSVIKNKKLTVLSKCYRIKVPSSWFERGIKSA
jgi:hypothetical protein